MWLLTMSSLRPTISPAKLGNRVTSPTTRLRLQVWNAHQTCLVIGVVADDAPFRYKAIWVAVVVVDSSGNAHIDMLTMVSASATDEGITDPGVYLPDIGKVNAAWFEQTSIFVEWEHSVDANVRGYHIYISDEMFDPRRRHQGWPNGISQLLADLERRIRRPQQRHSVLHWRGALRRHGSKIHGRIGQVEPSRRQRCNHGWCER